MILRLSKSKPYRNPVLFNSFLYIYYIPWYIFSQYHKCNLKYNKNNRSQQIKFSSMKNHMWSFLFRYLDKKKSIETELCYINFSRAAISCINSFSSFQALINLRVLGLFLWLNTYKKELTNLHIFLFFFYNQ